MLHVCVCVCVCVCVWVCVCKRTGYINYVAEKCLEDVCHYKYNMNLCISLPSKQKQQQKV